MGADRQGYVEVRAFLHLATLLGGQGGRRVKLSDVAPSAAGLSDAAPDDLRPDHLLQSGAVTPGAGVTVAMLAAHLGIDCDSLGMAMVNGRKAELSAVLHAGDRVAFFPDYIPYHRVYGTCVV